MAYNYLVWVCSGMYRIMGYLHVCKGNSDFYSRNPKRQTFLCRFAIIGRVTIPRIQLVMVRGFTIV